MVRSILALVDGMVGTSSLRLGFESVSSNVALESTIGLSR